MRRVEDVERVFQQGRFDKAALAVIQVYGYKGGPSGKTASEQGVGDQRLRGGRLLQQIDDEYQQHAGQTVIRFQEGCDDAYGGHGEELDQLIVFGVINVNQQKPQEQGEEYILTAQIEQIETVQQIKRQLGNGGEEQQPQTVAVFIAGVPITLGNQETENRKCQATDFAHDPVQGDGLA